METSHKLAKALTRVVGNGRVLQSRGEGNLNDPKSHHRKRSSVLRQGEMMAFKLKRWTASASLIKRESTFDRETRGGGDRISVPPVAASIDIPMDNPNVSLLK